MVSCVQQRRKGRCTRKPRGRKPRGRKHKRKAKRPEEFMHHPYRTHHRRRRYDSTGSLTDPSAPGAHTASGAKEEATNTGNQVRKTYTQRSRR